MEDELRNADFIVIVCTPAYNERYKQEGDDLEGLGGRWEASLVRDLLYRSHWRRLWRFVPVLPQTSTIDDIPEPLRVRATHYWLSDYDGLFRHLTGQRAVSEGPIGPLRKMPRRSSPRRTMDPTTESPRFSPEITQQYSRIDQRVEELTREQYRVITELHGRSRALISGAPGSGKTLVAAEKAMRLAEAGIKTLLLCHNPLLAQWLEQLTSQSMVDVRAFEDLVGELAFDPQCGERWSNYSQPTSAQLEGALTGLLDGDPPFQAVIVDEGQDFADDWWPIVEACIPNSSESTLYAFFDERQSLLPKRMQLPPSGWPLSLSRNCRNAGRIYDVMRHLSPGSPLPDEELSDLGHVEFFRANRLRDAVSEALKWCDSLHVIQSLTAILGGGADFGDSVLARGPFPYDEPVYWQRLVQREMRNLTTVWSNELRSADIDPTAVAALHGLSKSPNPTAADIRVVGNAAASIAGALSKRQAHFQRPEVCWEEIPIHGTRRVDWRLRGPTPKTSHVQVLDAFRCDVWAESLPQTASVRFAPHDCADTEAIPVYHLGEIKGLERNAVLLVLQGDAPQFMHHLFVGVSRARAVLAVVGDQRAFGALPSWLQSAS
jgi:hypothetical protein